MEEESFWARSDQQFLTNLQHETIRKEYEDFKLAHSIGVGHPISSALRREFDREMLKKYARVEKPPARTKWILKIWSFVPPEK